MQVQRGASDATATIQRSEGRIGVNTLDRSLLLGKNLRGPFHFRIDARAFLREGKKSRQGHLTIRVQVQDGFTKITFQALRFVVASSNVLTVHCIPFGIIVSANRTSYHREIMFANRIGHLMFPFLSVMLNEILRLNLNTLQLYPLKTSTV